MLEVYVFEPSTYNLFVHHDIILSSYPICMEWIGADYTAVDDNNKVSKGNFSIIGTFLPEIEIWDIDEKDPVEPYALLGKNGSGHKDAVTSLSINDYRNNILLSGSADSLIKIWDLNQNKAIISYSFNNSDILSAKWVPYNESLLLMSYKEGETIYLDARDKSPISRSTLGCDLEGICYNYNGNSQTAFLACENGNIVEADLSNNFKIISETIAHSKNVTSISSHSKLPGYLITTSLDGYLKLWDCNNRLDNNSITLKGQKKTIAVY